MSPLVLTLGYVAAILGLVNNVPQAVKVWKSGNDEGVNVVSWILGLIAVSGWLAYGLRVDNPTVIAANIGVICTSGMVLLAIQRARGIRLTVGLPILIGTSAVAVVVGLLVPLSVLSVFFIAMSAIPWLQATTSWRTLRAGSESYVSISTLAMRLASSLLWEVHGILIGDSTIMITAFIGSSATLLTIAMETVTARRQRLAVDAI